MLRGAQADVRRYRSMGYAHRDWDNQHQTTEPWLEKGGYNQGSRCSRVNPGLARHSAEEIPPRYEVVCRLYGVNVV
jgi:hypothetical protein